MHSLLLAHSIMQPANVTLLQQDLLSSLLDLSLPVRMLLINLLLQLGNLLKLVGPQTPWLANG